MRTSKDQRCNTRAPVPAAFFAVVAALLIQSPAQADSVYDITINTASLSGTGAALTFDFIAGGGTQSNSVTISNFETDGVLGSASTSGSATGALPGAVSLSNSSFFNELQQGMTLGSSISFQVDAATNAPTGGSLNDTFSLFLLDPTASNSLTNTNDPTGADSLLTLQIDGTSGGNLAVYGGGTSPLITVSAVPPSTAAPEIDAASAMSALTLLLGGVAVLRGRRIETKCMVKPADRLGALRAAPPGYAPSSPPAPRLADSCTWQSGRAAGRSWH